MESTTLSTRRWELAKRIFGALLETAEEVAGRELDPVERRLVWRAAYEAACGVLERRAQASPLESSK
jgi:hypothetical protein